MSLFASRLRHRFPKRKRDIRMLQNTCYLMWLTDRELQPFCDKLLCNPYLLDDFLQKKQEGAAEAEKYILSHIPSRRYREKRTEREEFNILCLERFS